MNEKHSRFRENNIKQMLKEIRDKQDGEIAFIEGRQHDKIEEIKKERNKKLRDLRERQAKEVKEMKWMYG